MKFWDHAVRRSANSAWSLSLSPLGNANCTFELRKICNLQLLIASGHRVRCIESLISKSIRELTANGTRPANWNQLD